MQHGAGCDMLVVQPPLTPHGCKYFGKNADLPSQDWQCLTRMPAETHPKGTKIQCTFMSIPQVESTYAWIGSQPVWNRGCWGVEMGANEHEVAIGSVALGSNLRDLTDKTERLFDVDVNRVVLERARTAREGVQIICELTSKYGQGGIMSENDPDGESYDGGYLVVDKDETWLVETTEYYYAARKVTEPWFNIANHMTIHHDYDLISPEIEQICVQRGLWSPENPNEKFNWASALGLVNDKWLTKERKCGGERYMKEKLEKSGIIHFHDVADFFRCSDTGICRPIKGPVATVSTMMCVFPPSHNNTQSLFAFTCTTDPSKSLLKPFIWSMEPDQVADLLAPQRDKDGKPQWSKLYRAHRETILECEYDSFITEKLAQTRALERQYVHAYMLALAGDEMPTNYKNWLRHYAEEEMNIYTT